MVRTGQGDDDAQLIPPVPATDLTYGDDDLLALGDERTLPPWSIVAGIVLLLALVIGLVALKWDGRHATGQPSGVPSGTPIESQQVQPIGTPIDLGQTSAVSVELAAGRLFVLSTDPWRLCQIDAKTGLVKLQVPAPLGAEHLVADPAGRLLWVVAGARVFAYDATTLATLGRLEISRDVVAAATLDGRLFLDTDHGIYMARPRDSAPTSLGYSGQVLQDLSADPAKVDGAAAEVDRGDQGRYLGGGLRSGRWEPYRAARPGHAEIDAGRRGRRGSPPGGGRLVRRVGDLDEIPVPRLDHVP